MPYGIDLGHHRRKMEISNIVAFRRKPPTVWRIKEIIAENHAENVDATTEGTGGRYAGKSVYLYADCITILSNYFKTLVENLEGAMPMTFLKTLLK